MTPVPHLSVAVCAVVVYEYGTWCGVRARARACMLVWMSLAHMALLVLAVITLHLEVGTTLDWPRAKSEAHPVIQTH